MNSPLVSVVIPTYNRAHLISETLESIISQTYTNWECIVVDDGSSDNTDKVLNFFVTRDNRIKYFKRPHNVEKGANSCRNLGFEYSKGLYVNWFDSDDIMLKEKLKIQVNELLNSKFSFTVCQTLVFENSIDNIKGLRKEKIYSNDFFNDFVQNKIKWLTQSPMFKREFILDNKLKFDSRLHRAQERYFFIKVLSIVDSYQVNDDPLVLFRKHKNSISHSEFYDTKKNKSTFIVNSEILEKHTLNLNSTSVKYLTNSILSNLKIAAINNDKLLVRIILSYLCSKKVNLSFFMKLKIRIGILSIKYLNKGDRFFKLT